MWVESVCVLFRHWVVMCSSPLIGAPGLPLYRLREGPEVHENGSRERKRKKRKTKERERSLEAVPPSLTAPWMITWMPARRSPVRHCSHAWASLPGHGAGRGQQVRRTRIRCHSACPLSTVGGVPPGWAFVVAGHVEAWLYFSSESGSCAAMPGVVGVRRGSSVGTRALA
jgi:hypothetical protein